MNRNHINKALALLIAGTFLFTGCGNGEDLFKEGKVEEYNQISRKVDTISSKFKPSGNSSEASNTQNGSINYSQQTSKALDMADEMALAQTFNLVTNEMLVKAGEAVKAYPHPLLLNNYAAMLYGKGQESDALYFFQLSLNQQPDNTVLLTNIANVYLDRENYTEAEQYAKRALAITSDYGPAYLVLTTIHLKNKNSELAAETMIKGAKQCFNSITIFHFESFLDAVNELDPSEDDYPLKEEFINDLYDIARENVDTKAADSSVDSPKGQIKLKPFPQITGADNLMKSIGYLEGEIKKIADKNSEAETRYDKYYEALSKHFDNDEDSQGTVPVVGNARQIYAIKVLESYYLYKIKQTEAKLNKKLDEIKGEREEKLDDVSERDYLDMKEAEGKAEDAGDKLLLNIFKGIFDEGGLPDIEDAMNKTVERENLRIRQLETELTTSKQFSREIIDAAQKAYNDMKQIFEEYWLKTGGVLKYINDEDVFNQLDIEREKIVYEYIWIPLGILEEEADYLNNIKRQRDDAEKESLILMGGMQDALAQLEEEKKKEAEKEKDKKGEDMVPDIEKEAISEYPENNVLGDLGAEVDLFGMAGASFQYNGTDKLNIEIDSTLGVVSGEISNLGGQVQKETYIATGVRAEGSTDWFTDTNAVKKALGSSGAAGKVLGKVNFGFKNGIRTGEYIVTDDNNRVIDRGMIHIRETGGEIGMFSRSTQVIVKKSYMTGLATKKTVVKNKFKFITYTK